MSVSIRTVNPALGPKKPVALGDAVKSVAQPVARVIDRVLMTDLSNCKTCEERRQKLNEKYPDLRSIFQ